MKIHTVNEYDESHRLEAELVDLLFQCLDLDKMMLNVCLQSHHGDKMANRLLEMKGMVVKMTVDLYETSMDFEDAEYKLYKQFQQDPRDYYDLPDEEKKD